MSQKYNLPGTYSRTGNLLKGDTTLLIATRPPEKVTPNKPPTYLLEVREDGKRNYLSSLYPTSLDGKYRLEKGRIWYSLELGQSEASITFESPLG